MNHSYTKAIQKSISKPLDHPKTQCTDWKAIYPTKFNFKLMSCSLWLSLFYSFLFNSADLFDLLPIIMLTISDTLMAMSLLILIVLKSFNLKNVIMTKVGLTSKALPTQTFIRLWS